ncbi:MAG: hypothetical protein WDM89_10560 [Rhizomicrobium sp.]
MTTKLSAAAKFAGAVIAGALSASACFAPAQAATDTASLQQAWRDTIAHTPTPAGGCFTATYPLTVWRQVGCVTAPNRPYVPATGSHSGAQTTGDGNDYAAVSTALVSAMEGSFPKAKGLKSETDGGSNVYSIQLNSQFMTGDQACAGASVPANCLGWLQYVYSSSEHAAFMQYWLIHYSGGSIHCPSGWNSFSTDCYKNSKAITVPQEPITDLPQITLTGNAVANGNDTLKFVDGSNAYSTSGLDTVMYLAAGWMEGEFNVIGDGGGSQANFNTGTKLTVKIAVTNGSTAAPTCKANDGTTGETNNLNLGKCTVKAGKGKKLPFVQFTESN